MSEPRSARNEPRTQSTGGRPARSGWNAALAALVVGLSSGWAGCAAHAVGWVETAAGRPEMTVGDGDRVRLGLVGGSAALKELDGYLVEVNGRRLLGKLQVVTWRAIEGPHGMPVWVGPVQRWGVQIGVADEVTGDLVWVNASVAGRVGDQLGRRVVIEGYSIGRDDVQVVEWRPLEP